MSLRSKRTGRPMMYTSSRGFSSKSTGAYSDRRVSGGVHPGASITPVSVNASLLTPLKMDIDPTIQGIRTQEKDQIKTLNNRFVSFIDKVRLLEQQNKMLETKWKLLDQQTTAPSNTEPMLKAYIANLQRQLELINNDKIRLDHENTAMHKAVNDYKTKYEDEINKRNGTENDFVMLKKEVDAGYLSKVDLEERVTSLVEELNFLKTLYDMELRELNESLKDTSAVVQMDNSRTLNMDQIVSEVKAQYEGIASRSREEAESWYKTKFDQMSVQADQYSSELRNTKGEIAELNRLISRLRNEIQNVQGQCNTLDAMINEAEERGDLAVKDANARIKDLEVALQTAKQDMARQVREYQELMNIKLALDIEIATYRKLLEGEEDRIGQQSIISVESIPCKSSSVISNDQYKSNPVLIKTVETWDRSYN